MPEHAAPAVPSLRCRWRALVASLPVRERIRRTSAGRFERRRPTGRSALALPLSLSRGERAVALALADVADADGCAQPGVDRLAELGGVRRITASRTLSRLTAAGLLTRTTAGFRHPDAFDILQLRIPSPPSESE